ncbi:hypothetical protein OMP38_14425 [Cohnella ginsengisoli]|uniref:Uncharacterized protein n=1 Tax=Cohnella ginsengisoli TaxID=425004 RepID=A0A9X4KKD6_9BACL|nr:hypothetical protein [Cohnella ginsengisoli]MDG0791912.1 hypothetical protein [Cohnella ginsengisoli]
MATMTQAQITAELQRKAAAGKPPSDSANLAQYNAIKATTPSTTTNTTTTKTNTATTNTGAPKQPVAPQPAAAAGTASRTGTTSSNAQALYNTVNPPVTGNGGADYNTSDTVTRLKMIADSKKVQSDPAFRQSEIERTNAAIAARKASGQDTSAQEKYLQTLTGKTAGVLEGAGTTPGNTAVPGAGTFASTGNQALIEQLYNNQYDSQLQMLKKARDMQLQGLNSQETQANQSAYDSRNQADVVNMQNAQKLRELVANNGMTGDGQNITANVGLGAARQGALNDINQQQSNALQNISEQRSLINNNASADDLALLKEIQAGKANALINNNQYLDDRALQLAQLMGVYNGQSTLAGKQQNINNALAYGDRAGMILSPQSDPSGYLRQIQAGTAPRTLEGTNQQFNQGITMAGLTGYLPDGTKTSDQQQRDLQNLWTVAQQTGTIPDSLASMYGLPKGTKTQDAYQFAQNMQLNRDQLSQGNTQFWANYNQDASQFQKSLDQKNATQAPSAQSVADYTDKMVTRDEDGKIVNTDSLASVILNSGLDSYNMWLMYQRYGIPWNGQVPAKPAGN